MSWSLYETYVIIYRDGKIINKYWNIGKAKTFPKDITDTPELASFDRDGKEKNVSILDWLPIKNGSNALNHERTGKSWNSLQVLYNSLFEPTFYFLILF